MAYKRKIKHGYSLELDEEEMEELKKVINYYDEKVEGTELVKVLAMAVNDKYY
jgi:hypothetical protein